jgi:hypothetical protein
MERGRGARACTGSDALNLADVDDSLWPLVVSVLPSRVTPRWVDRFFQRQVEFLDREQEWLHIVDSRFVHAMPCSETRTRLAHHLKRTGERSARLTQGTALLHGSSLMRGIVTALHWLQPPKYAFANVSSVEEAMTYLADCARGRAIRLPSHAVTGSVDAVIARITDLRVLLEHSSDAAQ